jgi:hypothetical protein
MDLNALVKLIMVDILFILYLLLFLQVKIKGVTLMKVEVIRN